MNQLTAGLIVAIGILGGFYVGAKYGQGHPPASTAAAATTTGTGNGAAAGAGAGGGGAFAGAGGGGGGGAGFGNATVGQITAVSGDTITIHNTQTNRDVKVNVSSARITKTADGSVSDLTQNTTVTVIGQAGTDGTVTATTIAIGNVALGGGRRGAGASPSPSPGS
jgi:hypothetical protein